MFDAAWKALAPHARKDARANRELTDLICRYYSYLYEFKKILPENQFIEVRYEDLVSDPHGTICGIYQALGMELSHGYEEILEKETSKARQYKSRHHYSLESFGLDKDTIYRNLRTIFEAYGFKP